MGIPVVRLVVMVAALATLAPPAAWTQTRRPLVSDLIAVLKRSDASLHEKARACQQLGEFGTREAVPALAALLPDKELSAYARSGLEAIPDPAAADALRAALRTLKGDLLIGAVNSLGVLRDKASVDALSRLATDPRSGAAKQALLALGRISTTKAVAVLQNVMSGGSQDLRPDAAAGCVLSAEIQLAEGNTLNAVALYEAIRKANVPVSYQMAATRGAILARRSDGINLLLTLLKSDDREVRNLALRTAREIRDDRLPKELRTALKNARPEVQAQLVEAITDCCRDSESVGVLIESASSPHSLVRQAALKSFGRTGDPGYVPVLLKALLNRGNPVESSVAGESLARIHGASADRLIVEALGSATSPDLRVALIDLLDARPPARTATGELLKLAGDADLTVSVAALRALRSFAGLSELPALVALTRTYKDGSQRGAAELTMFYASTVTPDSSPAGELLLSELNRSNEDLDKASLIKTLSLIGYTRALPSIAATLKDNNSWLVTTTIDSLGKWPEPAPLSDLLRFFETSTNSDVRSRTLAAAIQLVTPPFGRPQLPEAIIAPFYRRASQMVRSSEHKRQIVSGLAQWRTPESIRMLTPYLDDPDLRTAAASAIVEAATPVAMGPAFTVLAPVLEKISMMNEPALQERVDNLKATMAASEAAASKGNRPPR